MLEWFFVYPVRGIEQGGALQRTKNSPVDCFLARGRFPRVSPETLQLVLECFFVYPVRGIEQGSAPQRTKNSPVDCFLARGRFPRVSPETLQLVLECFFVYPVRGIEQGSAPQRTKNSPVDCFFSPREIPACVTRNTPAYAGVFFRVSRVRNRTRRCAGAFVRDNGTLCFWLYP